MSTQKRTSYIFTPKKNGPMCDECMTQEYFDTWSKNMPTVYNNPIVVKNKELTKCSSCTTLLCCHHKTRGVKNGYYYRRKKDFIMCDSCCWNEIT